MLHSVDATYNIWESDVAWIASIVVEYFARRVFGFVAANNSIHAASKNTPTFYYCLNFTDFQPISEFLHIYTLQEICNIGIYN